jgi:hypothetical protein
MKTNGTEVDLSTIPHESRKRVTFVVTSVNRFREESPIVEHVTYRYK